MAKSVEVKFNEALAELKAKVSPAKFTEVSEKLRTFSPIADKLKLVEEALAEQMPNESDRSFLGTLGRMEHELNEAKRDCGVLFGIEPRTAPTVKETVTPIKKHNGAADNGHEEFRESVSASNSIVTEKRSASDKALHEAMGLTAEQQRVLTGGKPAAYANLTPAKQKEYDFARLIGLSEADALRVATI